MNARVASALRELASERPFLVRIAGGCMAPALPEAALAPLAEAGQLWPGDVVAFRSTDGRLVAHRLLLALPGRLYTQADRAERADDAVRSEALLGRLDVAVGPGDRLRALVGLGRVVLRGLRRRLA